MEMSEIALMDKVMEETWIVPCNLKHFDIVKHFQKTKYVVWRNAFTMKVGDTAYIYVAAPVSAILYRCRVISNQVDDDLLQKNSYAIPSKESHNYFSKTLKFIQMELEQEYSKDKMPLRVLREHGLCQVQLQARAGRQLKRFLSEIDDQIIS